MTERHVVIVGAGAAGTSAAVELRRVGFDGRLTILNAEKGPPYNRTSVNKALLQPEAATDAVRQPIPDDAATLLLNKSARGVDVARRAVQLQDGSTLEYDVLLIASGARPHALETPIEEAARPRVTTLRTAADAARIRTVLAEAGDRQGPSARVIIAGASLLGAETADALNALGHDVSLVDPLPTPLTRLLGPAIGAWAQEQHRLHLSAVLEDRIIALTASGGEGITADLSGGGRLEGDLVIVAAGVAADTAWLDNLGVDVSDGVVTDGRLRVPGSSGVYAAGDVARVAAGRRGEHWGQALAQGTHAARVIAHDLGLIEDPGDFAGVFSYVTRLYGKPVSVIGSPAASSRPVQLVDEAEIRVTAFVANELTLDGLVIAGRQKYANRLRPLVRDNAALPAAVDLLRELGFSPRQPEEVRSS